MRIYTAVLSFILVCLCSSVQAVEPVRDHQMMLYYQIPIGADKQQDKKHKFGLRVDQTMQDPRAVTDFSSVMQKPAMLDLQFRHKEALVFKVHGVDYTKKLYTRQADVTDNGEIEPEVAETEATAGETEATEEEKEEKAEKTAVQKTLDELPIGVVIGVLLGIGILAGVGG